MQSNNNFFCPKGPETNLLPIEDNGVNDEETALYQKYEVGRVIGDGNFAVVKECLNRWIYSLDEVTVETRWEGTIFLV